MPVSVTVEYLLGDHLGSTSITTDQEGTKVSEIRYKPWGEIRSSWTLAQSTTPAYSLTDYTFTGQFSYMDDPSTTAVTEGFGLMFYNARFYDPALGRFISADSIIPGGVQGLDRYAYVSNSPINYTDPSGHEKVQDGPQQDKYKPSVANKYVPKPEPTKPNNGGCKNCSENKPDNKPGSDSDDGGPVCSPNLPNCNPVFSGSVSSQDLSTLSTNLNNLQSMLGWVSTGLGIIGIGFGLAAGVLAATPAVNVGASPVIVGLLVIGAVYAGAGIAASMEADQLNYLITEVNTMQSLAESSPTNTLDVYVSTDPGYYSPALNLDYAGAGDVYVANSIVTNLVLFTSFSNE